MPASRGPRADLHLHSLHSDGLLAPAAVVELAAGLGIATIALTDHDTFDGVAEATRRGGEVGVRVIPGVEISTEHPAGTDRHLLAYGVDPADDRLARRLEANRASRTERIGRMVEALGRHGLAITVDQVMAEASGRSVGRPHVADALVATGAVRSRQEAFERWIGNGKPGWVPRATLSTVEAIALVHGAGGVAVLAHPGRNWDRRLLEDLVRAGLDGIETIHPSNTPQVQRNARALARRHGLLETGGSDNHGDPMGIEIMRARRVPGGVADALLAALGERARAARRSLA